MSKNAFDQPPRKKNNISTLHTHLTSANAKVLQAIFEGGVVGSPPFRHELLRIEDIDGLRKSDLAKAEAAFKETTFAFLEMFEGVRTHVYDDKTGEPLKEKQIPQGKRTIGMGFNIDAPGAKEEWVKIFTDKTEEKEHALRQEFDDIWSAKKDITLDQVRALQDVHFERYYLQIQRKLMWDAEDFAALPSNVQLVLLSMEFNNPALLPRAGLNKEGEDNTLMLVENAIRSGKEEDWQKVGEDIRDSNNKKHNAGLAQRRLAESVLLTKESLQDAEIPEKVVEKIQEAYGVHLHIVRDKPHLSKEETPHSHHAAIEDGAHLPGVLPLPAMSKEEENTIQILASMAVSAANVAESLPKERPESDIAKKYEENLKKFFPEEWERKGGTSFLPAVLPPNVLQEVITETCQPGDTNVSRALVHAIMHPSVPSRVRPVLPDEVEKTDNVWPLLIPKHDTSSHESAPKMEDVREETSEREPLPDYGHWIAQHGKGLSFAEKKELLQKVEGYSQVHGALTEEQIKTMVTRAEKDRDEERSEPTTLFHSPTSERTHESGESLERELQGAFPELHTYHFMPQETSERESLPDYAHWIAQHGKGLSFTEKKELLAAVEGYSQVHGVLTEEQIKTMVARAEKDRDEKMSEPATLFHNPISERTHESRESLERELQEAFPELKTHHSMPQETSHAHWIAHYGTGLSFPEKKELLAKVEGYSQVDGALTEEQIKTMVEDAKEDEKERYLESRTRHTMHESAPPEPAHSRRHFVESSENSHVFMNPDNLRHELGTVLPFVTPMDPSDNFFAPGSQSGSRDPNDALNYLIAPAMPPDKDRRKRRNLVEETIASITNYITHHEVNLDPGTQHTLQEECVNYVQTHNVVLTDDQIQAIVEGEQRGDYGRYLESRAEKIWEYIEQAVPHASSDQQEKLFQTLIEQDHEHEHSHGISTQNINEALTSYGWSQEGVATHEIPTHEVPTYEAPTYEVPPSLTQQEIWNAWTQTEEYQETAAAQQEWDRASAQWNNFDRAITTYSQENNLYQEAEAAEQRAIEYNHTVDPYNQQLDQQFKAEVAEREQEKAEYAQERAYVQAENERIMEQYQIQQEAAAQAAEDRGASWTEREIDRETGDQNTPSWGGPSYGNDNDGGGGPSFSFGGMDGGMEGP